MSYTTIAQSVRDEHLIDRIRAAIAKEVFANATLGATSTGQSVKMYSPDQVLSKFVWPICIDNEAAYAYAIGQGNADPGGDEGVITDAAIGSGVQAHWPQDPEPPQLP